MSKEGAEQFAKVTKEGKGRRLGIVINGRLVSAPFIRESIAGGLLEISGNFTEAEAKALSDSLRACLPGH